MGAPQIITSNGNTRILFEGALNYENLEPPPKRKNNNDHEGDTTTYGVVYVNEVGRQAMAAERGKFPVGSIIVREKLPQLGAQPELLAVMIKRPRGFNRKANDWEFLIIDGDASKIRRREKAGKCQECHASQPEKDFVFRSPVQ